jgi:hypothetical protein
MYAASVQEPNQCKMDSPISDGRGNVQVIDCLGIEIILAESNGALDSPRDQWIHCYGHMLLSIANC